MIRQEAFTMLSAPGQPLEIVDLDVYGRTCRNYKHAPKSLRDLYQTNLSNKTFLVFEKERFSFADIWAAASAIGAGLVADHDIQKGDRVAICMRNYPEWIIAFQAITSVGGIVVAMNSLWRADEIHYGLQDSDCKLLIADQERFDLLAKANPKMSCSALIVRGHEGSAIAKWGDLQQRHAGACMPELKISAIDDVIILYTSGSTGRPKGVVSSNLAVISALLSWEISLSAWLLTRGAPLAKTAQQPAAFVAVPLFHVSGCHAVFLAAFRSQTKLVLTQKWDPAQAVMLIEQEKISGFTAPSAITADLTYHAQQLGIDLPSLVIVGGGGASRAPQQVRSIGTAFANAMPSTGWGMTETNSMGTAIAGDDYLERPRSSGLPTGPTDVIDIRIANTKGKSLASGECGEVQIRGTSMFRGYWNNPKATAAAYIDGWFKTGDVGYLDKEGYLFIVDRIKDMVIRGGENIGCGEVEAALLEHPLVREAAVYSVPDERLGEEVAATIYCHREIDEIELREFLLARLAKFKIPRYIQQSQVGLPRTASGKIFKLQIKQNAMTSTLFIGDNLPLNRI
jgi:long-chain acyl-CoA synthetase